MSEHPSKYVRCPVVVLRVSESQVSGDAVADALRDELLALYKASGAIHAVVDMEQVTYLSSAGIRPLLSLNREVRDREGRLILCNLARDVESVLVATRLVSSSRAVPATFEKHANVPESVASLYQAAG
jgi:anti-anti-sigma factor